MPVTRGLVRCEVGGLRNVTASPDDYREPTLNIGAAQVGVRDGTFVESHTAVELFGSTLPAHGAPDASSNLVEGVGPLHLRTVPDPWA